ncbi:unnamed protein product [Rotaria magnacalcarata]|uniref:Uncharacterized protein n=1 Tax=Rotaria magnacalcarata TaxID=392030 RepID=A0A8S3ERS6_9BILA|nr:unnamed protein product [Rotaria magnacalcarata]
MAATNNDPISFINKSLDTIEEFEDIFDIIDDDNDIFEYTIAELNKYFISGHLNSIPNEEEMTEEIQEEAILPQKFSQLSTASDDEERSFVTNKRQRSNVASSPTISSKKRKITSNNNNNDTDISTTEQCQIPTNLLIQNKLFVHMAQTIIKTVRYITMNDIQQMALLMH